MPRNPLMDDEGRLGMFYGVLLTKSCSLLWKITLGIKTARGCGIGLVWYCQQAISEESARELPSCHD
ncbi:hypothetical protein AFLA_004057 [Aspergillus flavus NRRL3357]|nr:hypothetical protein AFLA_004057 [Aspergillus flavus NRRL3357]